MSATFNLDELLEQVRVQRELPGPAIRRELREAAGLTQRDVAHVVGVDEATVSRWESGARDPRGRRRESYSALLKRLREEAAV
jgi:DNA-binding transcriptional regulator YiaG